MVNAAYDPTPPPARLGHIRRMMLAGLLAAWTLGGPPAQGQIADGQVAALVEALRLAAPQTGRDDDGLYSDWQIMPHNIGRWSQRCIGVELTPTEFESNPLTAREVLGCVMGKVLREQHAASGGDEALAVQRAAAWWLTGDPDGYRAPPAADYSRRVLDFYRQQRGGPPGQPLAASPAQLLSRWQEPAPAGGGITDTQIHALVEALRQATPNVSRASEGLYSDWQIKPNNIARWSRRCIGVELTPTEFESNPVTAREVLTCTMGDVLREQYAASGGDEALAVQRAAAWWFTGDPEQYSAAAGAFAQRVLDLYMQSF